MTTVREKMSIQDFMDYIRENFSISPEAQRLIENALKYAAVSEPEERHDILCFLLDGTIGLTEKEIALVF